MNRIVNEITINNLLTYLQYSATLFVVKCCTIKMPTKKRRIGFIPGFDVLRVIDSISEEEKLSNSKVVNTLIEEALYARGLIKNVDKTTFYNDLISFINKMTDLQNIFSEDDFKFDDNNEDFIQSKKNTKMYKRFIQFLYFKKMMRIFEKYS